MTAAGAQGDAPRVPRVVLLVTTPRIAPGCLSWPAWQALRSGPVLTRDPEHRQVPALAAAGVAVETVDAPLRAAVAAVLARAAQEPVVWLAADDGDEEFVRALGTALAADPAGAEIELVHGSYDVPGARLLDAVAVMDRLRSPGGCPWDAKQTHQTLGKYLLEEAYEAYQAIEDDDVDALREEMGDVLLQVLFHARVASERPADDPDAPGWSIDDVAAGLVEKLVRRHPHVFGDVTVSGAEDVQRNWDELKKAEKGRTSVTEGVPLGQPALALAAKLQKRAAAAGLPADLVAPSLSAAPSTAAAVAAAAGAVDEDPDAVVDAVGELLFTACSLAREHDVDPEAALRGAARRFRDRLAAVEHAVAAEGRDVAELEDVEWRERWHGIPSPDGDESDIMPELDLDDDESHHEP